MSPRAAWRLESLGFRQVYDYAAGKADWLAFGLPTAGAEADTPRVGPIARRDVPTCALDDRVGDVRGRMRAAGWDECLVLNEERVVLGRLRSAALKGDADVVAADAMEPGSTTVRPDERLATLLPRMRDKHVDRMIVTTSDGRLVGVADRETIERALTQHEAGEGTGA